MLDSEQSASREGRKMYQGQNRPSVGPVESETRTSDLTAILEVLSMKQDTSVKIKFGAWGVALGAVAAMVVGFGWGGWVTGAAAKGKTDEAVLANRAAICVAQFMRAPNHDQELKAFEAIDSWKRSELIGKGGWDKMPGQGEASGAVAEACARGIEVLAAK
jgi:hypothetical protein